MIALFAALLLQGAPLPPEEAPKKMTVPDGFKVTLFAGEPDVVQPIGFTFDDRGRLWVIESLTYPHWTPPGQEGRDRIVIFEDTDGDGRFNTRKVFADKLANLSGIAWGHGGVWLTALPYFVFVPDRNRDDVPDGPAEILLDGWDMKAKHNVFNKPSWGPDGWLYSMNGILSNSKVGKPGTPDAERIALNCGVWRFHPVTRKFEVVANGTTNPWGIDWDDYGRGFITNCVIKHVFQVIPGAHYDRMFGEDKSAPALYGLMPSPADHIHWAGGKWQDSRAGESHSDAGGGHAHVGAMIYLGDNWPDEYRGRLFTLNLHGRRMSHDVIEPKGSGVVAKHAKDFLRANDPWFRGLDLQYGPDGGVYVTDWTDTGECHDYDHCDMTNGRIYKITYGDPRPVKVDLAKMSTLELVEQQRHRNEWFGRHARRLLHERAIDKKLPEDQGLVWCRALDDEKDPRVALRLLWIAMTTEDGAWIAPKMAVKSTDEHVRAWGVWFLTETHLSQQDFDGLVQLASTDPSPVVRLALASALQKIPLAVRGPVAEKLIAHEEDATDANLPLMYWYGIEPIISSDREKALALLGKSKIPLVRQFITRRIAENAK